VCELICIVALPYYCRKFYPLVGVFAPPRIKKNNNIHTLVYNPTDLLYTQRCANANNILYTQHFLLKICNSKISSFCYAHKRPSPFFLYIPTKNPFSTIKYELTIEFLSANDLLFLPGRCRLGGRAISHHSDIAPDDLLLLACD